MDYSKLISSLSVEQVKEEEEKVSKKQEKKTNIKFEDELDLLHYYNEDRIIALTEELRNYFDNNGFTIFNKGTSEDLFQLMLIKNLDNSFYNKEENELYEED